MPSMKIPAHWTPSEALAVFEFIDEIRDQIWNAYGPEIQAQLQEDQASLRLQCSDEDLDF
ncbi:MAG: hypothetical protein K6L75_03285 [Cellvibrionaceae bacterium]|nr:hypothetical protein [Motiliproteus sp.]MCW9052150.1 hypothetical protein [Motiliproteus sp.]